MENKTFDIVLSEKLDKTELALPEGLNKARFVSNSYEVIRSNKDLLALAKTPGGREQLLSCLTRAAVLDLDAANKEFYLVNYAGRLEFMTSPKGARKLVEKYANKPVKDFSAFVVREGDEFEYWNNDGDKGFSHKPKAFNTGNIVGAVAYCKFADETMQIEVMSKEDIEAARKQSKAPNSPAWKNFYDRMAIKSAIHRLCNDITLEFENKNQLDSFLGDSEINNKPTESVSNPFSEEDVEVESVVVEESEGEVVDLLSDTDTEE